ISPILLLPLTALTAMVVYQSLLSIKQRATYRNQRKSLQSKLFGTIADILGNQALVRIFSRQDDEVARTLRERRRIEHVSGKEIDILQRLSSVRQITVFSFQIAIILLSIFLFSGGMIGVAAMVFTVTYLGRITGSMFNITAIIRQFEQAFLDAAKITEIIDLAPDIEDSESARDIVVKQGNIELSGVVFSYPENKTRLDKIFDGLTLSIPAGQRIGLVGHSGGGKTTLGNLLLRYVDIDSGTISIDGQNIAEVTQSSLRRSIGFVPQDPFLFHRSLRDNIAYGKPDATDEQIVAAAHEAHAMEFIERLPEGLDTVVGERGIKLSGGQRQRIAIARAILKDAPILVLDEATSALDSESEKLIQEALTKLMKGRTSIVIAHRLSTIAKLDRIIVLDEGQVVEDGTHDELIARRGFYAKLWAHQSGGFIDD
ncbi:MAG: ABC transporter ATP-binding protein, partial [Candidatus Saccharimonadaceae bacterium]